MDTEAVLIDSSLVVNTSTEANFRPETKRYRMWIWKKGLTAIPLGQNELTPAHHPGNLHGLGT